MRAWPASACGHRLQLSQAAHAPGRAATGPQRLRMQDLGSPSYLSVHDLRHCARLRPRHLYLGAAPGAALKRGLYVDEGFIAAALRLADQHVRADHTGPPEPCAQVRILPGAPWIRCLKTPPSALSLRRGLRVCAGVCGLERPYVEGCRRGVDGILEHRCR
jgi:hypothetical protein